MSAIRLLAEELQLSRVTVSAALRGLPWVKASTRERVLRRAEAHGYVAATEERVVDVLGIVRVRGHAHRGRAAVERHRVIVRAAREAAHELGYGVEELTVGARELGELPRMIEDARCRGLLVLSVASEDLLAQAWAPSLPCVYADIPPDAMNVDAVCPDYHQAMLLAMGRLRSVGLNRPGLILDNSLPLPARERILSAYSLAFSSVRGVVPPPLFTPVCSLYTCHAWRGRHAFDALLVTDPEYARRLTADARLPLFGIFPEASDSAGGLDLNLSAVGRNAVELLHGRIAGARRASVPPARVLVAASWNQPQRSPSFRYETVPDRVDEELRRILAVAERVI